MGLTAPAAVPWKPVPPAAKADPAELARDYPGSASVRLRLLNRQLDANDRAGAIESLNWLGAHGHIFSARSQAGLKDLMGKWNLPATPAIAAAPKVVAASSALVSVPADAQLVEAVVRDGKSGRLFATTVVSRRLLVRAPKGDWSTIDLTGADSLSGMVIDRPRRLLWVASGDLGMGKGPAGAFHGLIAIDLDSLKERRRIAAPEGVNPSDLALGCNGTIYASDPTGGGVYRAGPDQAELTPLIAPGTLRSPQGLAEVGDCSLLYVSDYSYGLALLSLRTGKVSRVEASPGLGVPLDGIDGLWWSGNSLIAVQNGTSPRRIVRLRPGVGYAQILSAELLEQANPAWSEPLSGGIDGTALIYVGNGQWDRFEGGQSNSGQPPLPTEVRLLQLRTTKH